MLESINKKTTRQILFVGDHSQTFSKIEQAAGSDHLVAHCSNESELPDFLKDTEFDLIFLDLEFHNTNALDILSCIQSHSPDSNMIVINNPDSLKSSLDQYKIFNIIDKPITYEKIQLNLERFFENRHYKRELDFLRGQQDAIYDFDKIIAYSPSFKRVLTALKKYSQTDSTILITGETGTGKSFLSSSVHYNSLRMNKPFVTINCANLPESILDSELFGHERGAFTGAEKRRIGRLEQADQGTAFLDEIAELSFSLQAKLLRILEEKAFERMGGNKTIYCDIRMIASTNKNPETEIEQGNLREDLYYRLNVLRVHIPPLRERRECIQPLADFLLFKNSRKLKKYIKGFTQEAMDMIHNYSWPGNIRQLQNTIERALILEDSEWIGPENLILVEPSLTEPKEEDSPVLETSASSNLSSLSNQERETILQALKNNDWIQKEASKELGITPRALNYRIRKYGITHKRWFKNKQ